MAIGDDQQCLWGQESGVRMLLEARACLLHGQNEQGRTGQRLFLAQCITHGHALPAGVSNVLVSLEQVHIATAIGQRDRRVGYPAYGEGFERFVMGLANRQCGQRHVTPHEVVVDQCVALLRDRGGKGRRPTCAQQAIVVRRMRRAIAAHELDWHEAWNSKVFVVEDFFAGGVVNRPGRCGGTLAGAGALTTAVLRCALLCGPCACAVAGRVLFGLRAFRRVGFAARCVTRYDARFTFSRGGGSGRPVAGNRTMGTAFGEHAFA